MPEYHQIQGYASLRTRPLDDVLAAYRQVLEVLGLWNAATDDWLGQLQWEPQDKGFSHSVQHVWQVVHTPQGSLHVAPTALGWTPAESPDIRSSTLEVGFLLESDAIRVRSPEPRYKPWTFGPLCYLMWTILELAPDFPVFFTDEAQDGNAWEALIDGNDPLRWDFDLAVVRPESDQLDSAPTVFTASTTSEGRLLFRTSAWANRS